MRRVFAVASAAAMVLFAVPVSAEAADPRFTQLRGTILDARGIDLAEIDGLELESTELTIGPGQGLVYDVATGEFRAAPKAEIFALMQANHPGKRVVGCVTVAPDTSGWTSSDPMKCAHETHTQGITGGGLVAAGMSPGTVVLDAFDFGTFSYWFVACVIGSGGGGANRTVPDGGGQAQNATCWVGGYGVPLASYSYWDSVNLNNWSGTGAEAGYLTS